MDYSDRRLTGVSVYGLQAVSFSENEHGVQGSLGFTISNKDGKAEGPGANLTLAVATAEKNPRIEEAERALLDGALAFLRRLVV